ncbi:MAG: nitroreductase family protein [Candidatus Margulisiibacteriota bacterium]
MLKDIVNKNRSYRRFFEDQPVSKDTLVELVELARLCPTAANKQPLRFILSCDPADNGRIFPYLKWAGYIKGWGGPKEGERPAAYIIIVGDTDVTSDYSWGDQSIAAQTMLLGAVEKGLGGCIIGSIDKPGLCTSIMIHSRYQVLLVVALGKPKEQVAVDDIKDGDVKYWRDENEIHHVPKRRTEDLILSLLQNPSSQDRMS